MDKDRDNGLIHLPSQHSVDDTVQRLQSLLREKNINLFAVIDHSGEAKRVGLQMNPTKLLIFGNPKGGTPLMQAAPTVAIDLPLKALVWQDGDGKVWLSYNDPAYLQHRHGFPEQLVANLSAVNGLLAKAAE
ncbi:MAG: DUF302 domain-containing protein [Candidatus Korobacteraceae bacterium]